MPVEIIPPEKAGEKRGAILKYANGITVKHVNGFGVHFFGDRGEVQVNRGKFHLKMGDTSFAKFTKRQDGGLIDG